MDVVGRHGLDRRPVAGELVVRKVVDDEARDGPHDRAGGLEPEREDPDEVVAAGGHLLGGDWSIAHPLELVEHLRDGRDRHLRVDRGPRRERPGSPAQVIAGARPVRVALVLTEVPVEARVEQPAEDRAHDRDRVEVGDPPRQSDVSDPDLRLDGARAMDETDQPIRDRRTGKDRPARSSAGVAVPVAEQAVGDRANVDPPQVAADDERETRRVDAARPVAPALLGPEALDRLGQSGGRPVVRRIRRVDRVDERLVGPPAGVRPCLEDVVQPLVAQPLDLALGERRPAHHLGEQLECGLEPRGRNLDACRHRVPARLGVERGSEPLRGLDERDRVIPLRALGQRPRG